VFKKLQVEVSGTKYFFKSGILLTQISLRRNLTDLKRKKIFTYRKILHSGWPSGPCCNYC